MRTRLQNLAVKDRYLLRLLALSLGALFIMSLLNPRFLSLGNLRSMAFQSPEFALLALAVMLAMLTGGIDLSVVGTALLAATAGTLFMQSATPTEVPSPLGEVGVVTCGCLAAVAVGAAAGSFNGILIAVSGISPILATLGTMMLYTGMAVVLTGGTSLIGFPATFLALGNGSLAGVPLPLFILSLAAGGVSLLLNRTALGREVYLTGESPVAARFAGLRINSILIRTYTLSGILSALAGILMAARTNSVNADYGSSYLLLAILVVVLAGVNPAGGSGRVIGLLLSVASLQFLSSGLNFLRVSSFAREMVWGAILLLIMCLNQRERFRKGEGR